MINGIEAYSKAAHFHGIFLFHALIGLLNSFPVFFIKDSVVLSVECRSLELLHPRVEQRLLAVRIWPCVEEKLNFCCTSIVSILNELLNKERRISNSKTINKRDYYFEDLASFGVSLKDILQQLTKRRRTLAKRAPTFARR